MKKQILIFATFTLAIMFAGMRTYGQVDDPNLTAAANCTPVTELTCAQDDHLHPIPGKKYTYQVDVTGVTEAAAIHWYVVDATTHPDIFPAGGYDAANITPITEPGDGTGLYLLSADSHYGTLTNVTGDANAVPYTIELSWQSFNADNNHILLVAYVQGADGCSDNLEAWRIETTFSFTLDIAGLMPDGTFDYGTGFTNANECVSPVQSASYAGSGATTGTITYDYGDNYVFFSVTAANFVHSWMPRIDAGASVHSGGSTITSIQWAYQDDAQSTDADDWHDMTVPVMAQGTSGAVGAEGQCIVVRMLVTHGTIENDTPTTVTLDINGRMYDASNTTDHYANVAYDDVDNPATSGDCVQPGENVAVYDLTPRPLIAPVDPSDPFVQP